MLITPVSCPGYLSPLGKAKSGFVDIVDESFFSGVPALPVDKDITAQAQHKHGSREQAQWQPCNLHRLHRIPVNSIKCKEITRE